MLKIIKERHGVDFDVENFSKQAGEKAFAAMEKDDLRIDQNLVSFLNELKKKGVLIALATSSLRWRVEQVLDMFAIRSYFTAIVTAEDVEEHKPNPAIFLKAASLLKADPKDCIVIEDAKAGIEGAKRANMKTVLFTGFHDEDDKQDADLTVKDFASLSVDILEKLF